MSFVVELPDFPLFNSFMQLNHSNLTTIYVPGPLSTYYYYYFRGRGKGLDSDKFNKSRIPILFFGEGVGETEINSSKEEEEELLNPEKINKTRKSVKSDASFAVEHTVFPLFNSFVQLDHYLCARIPIFVLVARNA